MSGAFRCAEVERFLDAFIDGEFSDEDRAAMEQHLAGCAACARRVREQAQFKAAVKKAAPRAVASAALRRRLAAALDEEAGVRRPMAARIAWVALPAAAAFAVGLFATSSGPSPVTEDVIAKHQRDLPVEITGTDEAVRSWFARKVDFAVRPPHIPNASLVGARLTNVGDRQAAYLVYDVRGEKVSVFMFDPGNLRMGGPRRTRMGDHDVWLDGQRGFNVAMYRNHGVGYAITSDMDEGRMLQLVSTAVER